METSKQYEMDLPVKMTPEEVTELANDLAADSILAARLEQEIEEMKLEGKNKVKSFQFRLGDIKRRLTEKAKCIVDGEEIRPVRVEEVVLADMSKVEIVRQDTGEVINERPVTEEDRQLEL